MSPDQDLDRIRELYLRAQLARDADELSYALSELVAAVKEQVDLSRAMATHSSRLPEPGKKHSHHSE